MSGANSTRTVHDVDAHRHDEPERSVSVTPRTEPGSKPGVDCLIELLRRRNDLRQYSPDYWIEMLAMAEEQRVLPWIAAHLCGCNELPAAIAARIAEIECEERKAAFFWTAELKDVLRAFAERGIDAVPLKGPSLAERIYGGVALRPCRDLDLLVARRDWTRAEDALSAIGFSPIREQDDYHRPWLRHTTKLELHYDVENPLAFDFHVATALERARTSDFLGEPCRLLAPEDELLYLCLHAARHRYERLGLVLDLHLAFQRIAIEDWQPRPQVAELNGLLVLGLLMARRLETGLKDGWNPGASDREWRHLETVANGLWLRLRTEPFQRRDWDMAHSFYLSLEPTRWRRLKRRARHARILSTRVIDRDRAFATRLGLMRGWQARLLRPVRLLADRIHPKL